MSQQRALRPVKTQNVAGHRMVSMMNAVIRGPRYGETMMAPDQILIFRLDAFGISWPLRLNKGFNLRMLVEEEHVLDEHKASLLQTLAAAP